ncbi:MAG: alpha/beta hydrolase [Mariniblastus sp.]|nr:alpha/beta hydrolase [Mariniblastus sp.]
MHKIVPTLMLSILICSLGVPALTAQTATGRPSKPKQDSPPKTAGPPKKNSQPKYADQTHVYKQVEGQDLSLHVTQPAGWKPTDRRPAVVFFHGGGWVGGKPGQFDEHCKHLAELGLVTVQVQYRLLKRTPKQDDPSTSVDKTPTRCIQDARSAMRWVRQRAGKLGIDPNRIASGGGSAGGHLAAYLGTSDGIDDPQDDLAVSARANAMLLFNPVYDNGPEGWGTARVGNRYPEFSPAHNITKDDAPAIVFLGTEDKLIPVETAKRFQDKMRQLGITSELHLYEGAGHGFFNYGRDDGKWFGLNMTALDNFLAKLGWIPAEQ